jgi:hypothetical protein
MPKPEAPSKTVPWAVTPRACAAPTATAHQIRSAKQPRLSGATRRHPRHLMTSSCARAPPECLGSPSDGYHRSAAASCRGFTILRHQSSTHIRSPLKHPLKGGLMPAAVLARAHDTSPTAISSLSQPFLPRRGGRPARQQRSTPPVPCGPVRRRPLPQGTAARPRAAGRSNKQPPVRPYGGRRRCDAPAAV